MIVSVNKEKCRRCGVCVSFMEGYCISEVEGFPELDSSLCSTCQKCVAICPHQAISVNGVSPEKIVGEIPANPDYVYSLLERRRSTKRFKKVTISTADLSRIVDAAKFAPNQNKNISVHVFSTDECLAQIEHWATQFVTTFYKLLFGFPPLTWVLGLLVPEMKTIKRKMEFGFGRRPRPKNTQAVILVSGKRSVPVTESSAHYMLATMMFYAESLGVESCLMDSIYLALRTNSRAKRSLGIKEDVLGALVLGYSAEGIKNIPKGYEVPVVWN